MPEKEELFDDTRKLIVGQKYRIALDDCCIQGEITMGMFQRFDAEEDKYIFDAGRIGPGWGEWSTSLIPGRLD